MSGQDAKGGPRIAVVIPCFKVREHIIDVLIGIDAKVADIIVVDDACPEGTGAHVQAHCNDARVRVVTHSANQGVGGAVMTGYHHAIAAGADVIVKLDGDGQMDPALMPRLVDPILRGEADYTKGNRFHNIDDVKAMPAVRILGNAGLSFLTKLSSGYWTIFDPTNGYTAISAVVVQQLPFDKIARRFFFESDMLFRLGIMRAHVIDIPMRALYGKEQSNLRITHELMPFLFSNLRNFGKRIFYNYFLRDFSVASLQLIFGMAFMTFGTIYGINAWVQSATTGVVATTGQVMLAALPVILGVQMLLSFISLDIAMTPSRPIQSLLRHDR